MSAERNYTLGVDLGSASLGWALIEHTDGAASGIIAAGVRIFSPGVDGNLDRGQEESRNLKRREARLHRRQLRRRTARQRELFSVLQSVGLLPEAQPSAEEEQSKLRQRILSELDRELWLRWKDRLLADPAIPAAEHTVPYVLRARGLEERLGAEELGRALYHLGQRRGFLSNRKAQPMKDEKPGDVTNGISELRDEMQAAGASTLGKYFCGVDPTKTKIRRRWTERSMFLDEFDRLWRTQHRFHPALLSDELCQKIHHLLFYQRPLQDNEHLVGQCELEPSEKRAPLAYLEAQRFRLLQRLNDMEVEEPDGRLRPLREDERRNIVDQLEREGDQSFASLRKLIGASKGARFNFERGGEKNCRGNRTASRMRRIFGARWESFSVQEQQGIVEVWRKTERPADLERIAREQWHLNAETAALFSDAQNGPEPGYCRFSLKALAKLNPLLEGGLRLQSAVKEKYSDAESAIYDFLPPVRSVLSIRNPAIERALTELRKVVNAIVREYGKPAAVRIELARDLKRSREDRKRIWEEQRVREAARNKAAEAVCREVGRASREDIEKYLLADECGWKCPYTGKPISMHSLFTVPEFQVEHILPLSRFPDSSFQNKTLCHVSANRDKAERTPWEAFHADEQHWAEILVRVKDFGNPAKLRRFQMTPEETEADKLLNEFTGRQLGDTRYASKLAAKYLGLLYGGRDQDGKRRVFVSSGAVTATLRQLWGLNGVLGLKGEKNRDDHRHHAVDAIVIALTAEGVIRQMAERSKRNQELLNPEKQFRPFRGLQTPWSDFYNSVEGKIKAIYVSHRPEHKLSGQLHEETLYGKPYQVNGKQYVNIRKPLSALSQADIEDIVDNDVRAAVQRKLTELNGNIKKLNSISPDALDELPWLKARDGRRIPVKRVRIRRTAKPVTIGKGSRERRVQPGNNHHLEVFSGVESPGRPERWIGRVVSLLEAAERHRHRLPVVDRRPPEGKHYKFVLSLMNGDLVEMDDARTGLRNIFVVRGISTGDIDFVRHTESRTKEGLTKKSDTTADFVRARAVQKLQEWNCKKVTVDPLGRVHYVNESKPKSNIEARAASAD